MSVLQNPQFVDYPFVVPAVHHTTKTHKPEKVLDPKTRKEVERCPKYPSITCDVHENMRAEGCDASYTPASFILGPDGKVIFGAEEMKKANQSVGLTVKKLDEAVARIGPGLSRPTYEKILKDLEAADKDIAEEKYDKAIKAIKKLADSKAVPASVKEGRLKAKLAEIEAKGKELLEAAKSQRESAPDEALKAAKKVATQFKGTEVGKEAADLAKEWEAGEKKS